MDLDPHSHSQENEPMGPNLTTRPACSDNALEQRLSIGFLMALLTALVLGGL